MVSMAILAALVLPLGESLPLVTPGALPPVQIPNATAESLTSSGCFEHTNALLGDLHPAKPWRKRIQAGCIKVGFQPKEVSEQSACRRTLAESDPVNRG